MTTCSYCNQPATHVIIANPHKVCYTHALEFWTGLLAYTHGRPYRSLREGHRRHVHLPVVRGIGRRSGTGVRDPQGGPVTSRPRRFRRATRVLSLHVNRHDGRRVGAAPLEPVAPGDGHQSDDRHRDEDPGNPIQLDAGEHGQNHHQRMQVNVAAD